MIKFKKSNYKFWHSPFALILLFCFLIFFGYKIIDLVKKDIETSHEKRLTLDKINNLEGQESSLNKDISKLQTDEGKEEIIRDKYPVAKEGEKMVTIVDEESKVNSGVVVEKVGHGFWNWIKGIFKK